MPSGVTLVKSYFSLISILCAALSAQAYAQNESIRSIESADTLQTLTTTSPAAYVYVSSTLKGGNVNEVEAFSAAPDGKLTSIPGSPFQDNVTNMAVNGKYLFAVNSNGFDLDAYLIESDGALHFATSTNASQSGDCNVLGPLVLDHSGSTLYDMEFDGSGCANNTFESFEVNKSTGALKELGNSSANDWLYLPVSFIGNNVYAYTASCIANMYWGIYGFERSSSGLLTEIATGASTPKPPSGYFYCPSQAAADPTDHVAIAMQPVEQNNFSPNKPAQLATYTSGTNGSLSTTSTAANMPQTLVGTVTDLNMAPGGKLLAVGGTAGLQIFHFNGAGPITDYTGLLTKDEIDKFFWDNDNHLYAISHSSGKLFVFTVTPTTYSEAPGSPYSINEPVNVIVQPK